MLYLGDFPASHTAVCIPFASFAAATGASSATSGFTASDIQIYKDGGTTQRASSAGITVTADFDTSTGLNMITIDLSDNTDAGFYAAGHEYSVAVADVTIDSQTVRFWAGCFSIERANGILALLKANGTIKVDAVKINSAAVSTSSAQIGVNVVNAGGTAWASGSLTSGVFAANAIDSNALAASAVSEFLTTQMTESYNADGAAPTLAQALHLIIAFLTEKNISGTTLTAKKLDGSTTAATFTLDSSTAPTSITRAT